jgi:hypothetical protein
MTTNESSRGNEDSGLDCNVEGTEGGGLVGASLDAPRGGGNGAGRVACRGCVVPINSWAPPKLSAGDCIGDSTG